MKSNDEAAQLWAFFIDLISFQSMAKTSQYGIFRLYLKIGLFLACLQGVDIITMESIFTKYSSLITSPIVILSFGDFVEHASPIFRTERKDSFV